MNRRPPAALATAIVLGGLVLTGCNASDTPDDGAGSAVAATREASTALEVPTPTPRTTPVKHRVASTRGELELLFAAHPLHHHIE